MRLQLESPAIHTGTVQTSATGQSSPIAPSSGGRAAASAAHSSDRISLSRTSSLLGRVQLDHAARLAQLTQAVRAGTYRVPAAAISRSLIASSLAAGSAGSGAAAAE
jgi:anti-sigma28 factor (negative regulator of flagellin synthesis)